MSGQGQPRRSRAAPPIRSIRYSRPIPLPGPFSRGPKSDIAQHNPITTAAARLQAHSLCRCRFTPSTLFSRYPPPDPFSSFQRSSSRQGYPCDRVDCEEFVLPSTGPVRTSSHVSYWASAMILSPISSKDPNNGRRGKNASWRGRLKYGQPRVQDGRDLLRPGAAALTRRCHQLRLEFRSFLTRSGKRPPAPVHAPRARS